MGLVLVPVLVAGVLERLALPSPFWALFYAFLTVTATHTQKKKGRGAGKDRNVLIQDRC